MARATRLGMVRPCPLAPAAAPGRPGIARGAGLPTVRAMTEAVAVIAKLDPVPAWLEPARIVAIHGVEELCRASRFEIELTLPHWAQRSKALAEALNEQVGLHLGSAHDGTAVRDGIITGCTFLGVKPNGEGRLRLVVEDHLALLGYGRQSRAFTAVKPSDVVGQVLSAGAVPNQEVATFGDTVARLVQWQESDLAFITRMLGANGGFFYSRPGADPGKQVVVVGNSPRAYGTTDDAVDAVYVPSGEPLLGHGVTNLTLDEGMVAQEHIALEHQPEDPTKPYRTSAQVPGRVPARTTLATPAIDALPRWLPAAGTGTQQAKRAAAASAALRRRWSGHSGYASLHAGRALKMDVPDLIDSPGVYLMVRVEHHYRNSDDGAVYHNEFFAIDHAAEWHPHPPPQAPRVSGVRLGVVVDNAVTAGDASPDGSTLDHAVYEVAFPSEPAADGSPLVQRARMAKPAAGKDRGLHLPPEVGDEVVIVHQHGEPDRPLIIGVLYNRGFAGPAVATRDGTAIESVLRTRTGHELRFVDEPGKERIAITTGTGGHSLTLDDAGKRVALSTSGTLKETVDVDHATTVTGDRTLEVQGKRTATITGDDALTVQANHSVHVTGTSDLVATGAASIETQATLGLRAQGAATLGSAASVTVQAPTLTLTADSSITLGVGGSTITIDASGVTINGPTLTIQGGSVTVSGDTTATLQGGASTTVSGPAISVSATGTLTLSGATISANG